MCIDEVQRGRIPFKTNGTESEETGRQQQFKTNGRNDIKEPYSRRSDYKPEVMDSF